MTAEMQSTDTATISEAVTAETTTDVVNTDAVKTEVKDPDSAQRYAISRAKEAERIKWEKKYNDLKSQIDTKSPLFDDETDPKGIEEIKFIAKQEAKEEFKAMLEDLGLDDKIESINRDRQQDKFFEDVSKASESFKKFGIETNTELVKSALITLEQKGITPEQLILLAHSKDFLSKISAPKGFSV